MREEANNINLKLSREKPFPIRNFPIAVAGTKLTPRNRTMTAEHSDFVGSLVGNRWFLQPEGVLALKRSFNR
jgi:hypothetical protein